MTDRSPFTPFLQRRSSTTSGSTVCSDGRAAPGADRSESFFQVIRRLLVMLVSVAALMVGIVVTTTGTAEATVGNLLPKYTYYWGDCRIDVGTVPQSDYSAVGGTDVSCNHVRGQIYGQVDLWWRPNTSTGWTKVATSGWRGLSNTSRLSLQTGAVCGGGYAQWDITSSVYVDGYRVNLDYGRDSGNGFPWWQPRNC
jgi:hypothetical protein